MALPRIIADFETQLSTAISVGGTTFDISSNIDDDGVALQAGTYCFTIDNGSSSKEYLIGTLSGSTVSSVSSVSRQGALTSGAVRAHRVGASVMITDFIALRTVAMMIAGDEALDGTSPLIYDTAPTLSDPKELATVAYVLSVVTGGTVNFSSQTISATAGETLSGATTPVRVYFKESDSRWWKVDTDDTATYIGVKVGFAISTATAGNSVTIQLSGIVSGFTGLTTNSKYYGSTTGGNIGTSVTNDFVGWSLSTTQILMAVHNQELNAPTVGEKQALAGGSTFGTPSSSNKYITQEYNSSATGLPVRRVYGSIIGDSTTQFDITNPSGTTFRYTYDSTGTNPNINTTTVPTGTAVFIHLASGSANMANNDAFTVTGSGSNYFEVTNASGVIQNNITIGNGYLYIMPTGTWSKPAGLKYVDVELVGGGGSGGTITASASETAISGSGAAGGYSRKLIAVASLGSTETITLGAGGKAPTSAGVGNSGGTTSFGSHLQATGGSGGVIAATSAGASGGLGSGGDVNLQGGGGSYLTESTSVRSRAAASAGGSSFFGGGGSAGGSFVSNSNVSPYKHGAVGSGGGGATSDGGNTGYGGYGMPGIVIVTEYYS